MKTAYQNISDTNTAFGNLFGSCIEAGVITNYEKLYNQAVNLYDELDELRDDGFNLLKEGELSKIAGRIGMADAIGDLIVFLYGIPHFLGYKYLEKSSNENLKDVIISFKKDEFYDHVYDDLKSLIDEIVSSIQNKKNYKVIMNNVQELDIYLATICSLYQIDRQLLIDLITKSNMSKLCANNEDVKNTMEFYQKKGVDVYYADSPLKKSDGTNFQVVYSSKEQEVEGKVYRAHKFLKCVNWFEPDLTYI